jgi:hypothetical protein
MMKNLLLVLASLMVVSAGAQSRKTEASRLQPQLSITRTNPKVNIEEMQMRTPGTPVAAPVRDTAPLKPFYRRPAGAFYCSDVAKNGVFGYGYGHDLVLFKPYAEYTFYTSVQGEDQNTDWAWDTWIGNDYVGVDHERNLKLSYDICVNDMPIFYATDGPFDDPLSNWYSYQMPYYNYSGAFSQDNAWAWSIPYPDFVGLEEGIELLLSSKTTCPGGRNRNYNYTWTALYDHSPYMTDDSIFDRDWWFGKNTKHIDGMAQAFECPENPYLLKKVYLYINYIDCRAPVDLTCKIYRLENIPPYQDEDCAVLPEVPGELIAIGKGTVTSTTDEATFGLVGFEIYGFDEDDPELIYEYEFTVDYPILVVIEGYNDEAAADLVDFTAYICSDYHEDEGYGEMAYLKYPVNEIEYDENGDTIYNSDGSPKTYFTGNYYWKGLNNFFTSGEMMTGFSIFIVADQPYVTLYDKNDDGEYTFPDEGGLMDKYVHPYVYDGDVIYPSIVFLSCTPSEDDGWILSCNGTEELPDWLDIELIDGVEDECFDNYVMAMVTAEPLPQGIEYREAVVRFGIPGDYQDYKFKQGQKHGSVDPPDTPPIVVINAIIDLIIRGEYDSKYDLNRDGEITIADINVVVDFIYRD